MFFDNMWDDIFEALLERKKSSGSGGEDIFSSLIDKTITEITAKDLKGATKIGPYAFAYCENLINVTIPNGVTSIGQGAFTGCGKLKTRVIPGTVTSIDGGVFERCYDVENAYYDGDVASLCNLDLDSGYSAPGYYTYNFYIKNSSGEYEIPEHIIIPNTVTEIKGNVFYGCKELKSVRIGNGITNIHSNAFRGVGSNLFDIYIDAPEGSISGAPWSASKATVHWNTPLPSEEV